MFDFGNGGSVTTAAFTAAVHQCPCSPCGTEARGGAFPAECDGCRQILVAVVLYPGLYGVTDNQQQPKQTQCV